MTAIDGLAILRSDHPKPPTHMISRPAMCIVAQGAKWATFGGNRLEYRAGQALVVGVETPSIGRVVEASPGEPCLVLGVRTGRRDHAERRGGTGYAAKGERGARPRRLRDGFPRPAGRLRAAPGPAARYAQGYPDALPRHHARDLLLASDRPAWRRCRQDDPGEQPVAAGDQRHAQLAKSLQRSRFGSRNWPRSRR